MKYKSDWEDMSDYLVHFSKGSDIHSAYIAMMGILSSRVISARNPFGFAKGRALNKNSQRCVCLSETPLHLIERISKTRGPYGIGFTKNFVASQGGNPIWYVLKQNSLGKDLDDLLKISRQKGGEIEDIFWRIAPFFDIVTKAEDRPKYKFEWEREWRVCGGLSFETQEVAFLVIPENRHQDARDFFKNAEYENTGPNYKCPYIDIGWSIQRIEETFKKHVAQLS